MVSGLYAGHAISMSKRIAVPESGKCGPVVHLSTRYGQVAKQLGKVRDPRTPAQLACRSNMAYVSGLWGSLQDEQCAAWDLTAADRAVMTFLGRSTSLPGYNLFMDVNVFRLSIGLSVYDTPPVLCPFPQNPVAELAHTIEGDVIRVRVRVLSQPVEHTLVLGALPCSPGRRCVQHFPFLGFLPAPVDGWCDITELFVKRYGVLPLGKAIFIQIRQHINGWNDPPKQFRTVIRPV